MPLVEVGKGARVHAALRGIFEGLPEMQAVIDGESRKGFTCPATMLDFDWLDIPRASAGGGHADTRRSYIVTLCFDEQDSPDRAMREWLAMSEHLRNELHASILPNGVLNEVGIHKAEVESVGPPDHAIPRGGGQQRGRATMMKSMRLTLESDG